MPFSDIRGDRYCRSSNLVTKSKIFREFSRLGNLINLHRHRIGFLPSFDFFKTIELPQLRNLATYSNPITRLGFSGLSFSNCRKTSFVSSEMTRGKVILTSTNWSPRRVGFRRLGKPRSRRRNFCPDSVPDGIFNCAFPSTVGTSILVPNAASETVIGTVI